LLAALLLAAAAALPQGGRSAGAAAPEDEMSKVKDILADDALWGDDFTALLASLKDWGETGQREVEVFGNEAGESEPATAATPTPNEAAASLARAGQLNSKLSEGATKFKTDFEAKLKEGGDAARIEQWSAEAALQNVSSAAYLSRDAESPRVMLLRRSESQRETQFLKPGLTISMVEERRGQPEQFSYRRIEEEGDTQRPVILKLHHYAGGAVKFAESNVTPAGVVERVILDVRKISSAIF
jgi:hypothetical protein